jgi:superfamily II DNA or RNA helicase
VPDFPDLRRWQKDALERWKTEGDRGIVSVVTGGGKTIFALACIERIKALTTLIVVPTAALLDQWWEETAAFFSWRLDDVNIVTGSNGIRAGTVNIAILNTAAKLAESRRIPKCFLIIDECHRAASPAFRRILAVETFASLGLSATPERPYDEGLSEILIPALGPVIYEYTYSDAKSDNVIVPFTLRNVVFELEPKRQEEYDKLTKAIARSMQQEGPEGQKTIGLLLKRSRVLNMSDKRIVLALRLVALKRSKKTLVFHENIDACEIIANVLRAADINAAVYHSRLRLRARAEVLSSYRSGEVQVLVTCRALDEGFNVPETEVGIIAASTATMRQRIQRLGRIVRPATGKNDASIYTLVATAPEIARLKTEEEALEGVAAVTWGSA